MTEMAGKLPTHLLKYPQMKTFPELFKKYRLKAEFETFSEFGEILSQKGFHYEESIFSRWQNGTRSPGTRKLILTIIEIFVEREAIKTIDQANEFIASTGQGYLTEKEKIDLYLDCLIDTPFQVPEEIADFTGREEYLEKLTKDEIQGKVIHIYGSPGVGKTALAIKLAHLLRYKFFDGIFWYRMENILLKDIFISLSHLFNKKLPKTKNLEVQASFIRSLLSQKKILLILDNVEQKNDLHSLLPITSSTIIVISISKNMYIPAKTITVPLKSFVKEEVISLFENVLSKAYVNKNKDSLIKLSHIVGDLPLAVHIFASQLKQSKISPKELFVSTQKEQISLRNLSYENKDLYLALQVNYKNLSQKAQVVFLSLGAFEGKDFSLEAIAYMNGLSSEKARIILEELQGVSLMETSLNNRYRIHPIIKKFIAEKLTNPKLSMLMTIVGIFFILFTSYWIITQLLSIQHLYNYYIFSSSYFVVAVYGGLWGVGIAKKWGGLKSVMGKAICFFSLGLFSQAVGQILYGVYDIFFHIQAAYPSLGDVGYFATIPLYIYGVIFLGKASGIKRESYYIMQNLKIFVSTISLLLIGYLLLLQQYIFDWTNPIKIFLDFAYPLGDIIFVYLAFSLYMHVKKIKADIIKNKIMLITLALFTHFLSDFVFVYQKNLQTWHVGQLNDYMYFFAYLLMTLAIIYINSGMSKIITR